MKMKELAQMRFELINAIVQWDRLRAGKSGYSLYALPHYLNLAEGVVDSVVEGESMRKAINDRFEGELLSFILMNVNMGEAQSNPRDARASSRKEEYDDFSEWERDAFAAGATQIVKLGEGFSALRTKDGSMVKVDAEGYFDPRSRDAIKNRKNRINIGSWLGDSGTIYRHIIKNHPEFFAYENPLRPRKGESARAFVSRCMSEEKMSFPEPKQRIAVCLSKSRKRNPVYDTGSDE